jgi:shikimate dehydrogenase
MTRPIPKLAGVCGWPIHHSLSPLLHSYWLKEMGVPGAYVPFAVNPKTAVEAFQSLKKTSISGVNVTLPLKSAAFQSADVATEEAQKLGVANCLYKSRGQLVAHNTDLEGFAAPLISKLGADHIQIVLLW